MNKEKVLVIKIGGNSIDNPKELLAFLETIATIKTPFILVHGGGKLATDLAEKLNKINTANYSAGIYIFEIQLTIIITKLIHLNKGKISLIL